VGATKSKIPFTYADYKSLPEAMDRRYELMDGELCLVPAPTTLHQFVSQNIETLLVAHVRAARCGRVLQGPVDVVLGEGDKRDVLQPDIVFVSRERPRIVTLAEVAGAPDLVIEILSRGTKTRDRGYKRARYERARVREYWIVDPDRETVDVFRLGPEGFAPALHYRRGDELECAVLPGFRVPVDEIFKRWD
jgi:Uma2 family endonuclease